MATRHERVIIDLDDRFSRPMAKAAASTSLFRKNVDDAGRSTVEFDRTVRTTSPSIDQFSGRLGLLARAAAAIGPGLIPITTAAIPAVAGLATQLGFAAAGAGTAALAFSGMGDALDALNEYQLEPTAENFAKVQEEMKGLGPAARQFVLFLDEIIPQLQTVREAAQEGLLPGAQAGLDAMLERLPEVRDLVSEVADATGDLLADAGGALASSEWDQFFTFLETEARPALTTLGQTVGNLARGVAELWMAFDPLSDDFTFGMLEASEAFADWADTLSQTEGFADFIAYIRETGPQVLETIGSLGNALLQIGEAAAPLGGPVLKALEAIADAVAAIADSPIGPGIMTAVTALSALSLAAKGVSSVMQSTVVTSLMDIRSNADKASDSSRKAARNFKLMAGAAGGLVVLQTAAGWIRDIQDATFEALPGVDTLTRRMLMLNDGRVATLGEEFFNVAESIRRITDRTTDETINDALQVPFEGIFGEVGSLQQARAEINRLDDALANLVAVAGSAEARQAFREFAENQGLSVEQTRTLRDLLPDYREALARSATAADVHRDAIDGENRALDDQAIALQGVIDKMRERRELALEASGAEISFEQAKDDAAERVNRRREIAQDIAEAERELAEAQGFGDIREAQQDLADADTKSGREAARDRITAARERRADDIERARENLARLREEAEDYAATLDTNTQAGRDNQAALDRMAESWNNLTDKQQNAKGAFKSAREDLIDQAIQFGDTREEAEDYADEVLEIPPRILTEIQLEKEAAERRLREFKDLWDTLHPKRLQLFLELRGEHQLDRLERLERRGGGLASGFASGGYTGNLPRNAAAGIVHGQEFVVRAEQTAKHRQLLEAINAGARGYRDGGFVAASPMSSSVVNNYGAGIDLRELADIILRARPMFGQAVFNSSGDYERAKRDHEMSNRAAAFEGGRQS